MRLAVLVMTAALVGCGRASVDAADGVTEPTTEVIETPDPSASEAPPPETPGPEQPGEPTFLPWDGEVPLWPLSYEESAEAIGRGGLHQRPEDYGLPRECGNPFAENHTFENCAGRYLTERGVSAEAQMLYRQYRLTVSQVEGTGRVQILHLVADWDLSMSVAGPGGYAVRTSRGILTGAGWWSWSAWKPALREADGSDVVSAVGGYYGECCSPRVEQIEHPEHMRFADPTGSADVVVVAYRLGGRGVSGTDFYARFEVAFAVDGAPVSVRFVDFCWDPVFYRLQHYLPPTEMVAIADELAVPPCNFS